MTVEHQSDADSNISKHLNFSDSPILFFSVASHLAFFSIYRISPSLCPARFFSSHLITRTCSKRRVFNNQTIIFSFWFLIYLLTILLLFHKLANSKQNGTKKLLNGKKLHLICICYLAPEGSFRILCLSSCVLVLPLHVTQGPRTSQNVGGLKRA